VVLTSIGGGSERVNLTVLASEAQHPREEPWDLTLPATLFPLARLEGRLVAADGTVRAHARLNASGGLENLPSWCSATTDAEGRFVFEPLLQGDWTLTFGEEGSAVALVQGLQPGETRALGELAVE
jgi:hypothetical protein